MPGGQRAGKIMFILDTENLINTLKENNQTLWEYALNQEMERSGRTREELREQMDQSLSVMERSAQKARREPVRSVSGLTGGNACLYEQYRQEGKSLLGEVASLAVGMALSCSEINASMQCIVACPTAGSCGIVPAAVLACAQSRGLDRECMVNALFTASAIGIIIGSRATVSGAEGGCQAECGAAAAMGAAAVTEMLGGSPEAAFHAAAMALKMYWDLPVIRWPGLWKSPVLRGMPPEP